MVRDALAKGATRTGAVLSALGELDADVGDQQSAKANLDDAVLVARRYGSRAQLIVALTRQGHWAARHGELDRARVSLTECLEKAAHGEYTIFEAQARVAWAWLHYCAGQFGAADREAAEAQRIATERGLHWEGLDANNAREVVLAALAQPAD